MNYFGIAVLTCLFLSLITYAIGGWALTAEINAWVGVILLGIGALLSGAFISGDRLRANDRSSTDEDRQSRNRWIHVAFLSCIPFLFVAIFIFALLK
ncbi:DUF5316 domain-containing protein [Paenibacillus sp. MER TA 81-3]|uniref:DUF5316 family protein n=1 Tax=Paenibacillus sp. MER TA 81-3 TaxID=2939573 RepID=UPI00203B2004|nr:DUF5316 family protein [Paenibacillus sp. MER TA 81-3]MCM3342468.1 DUF5316 domain-containing protein [Paenibacillus sp. MER TA 81-3]